MKSMSNSDPKSWSHTTREPSKSLSAEHWKRMQGQIENGGKSSTFEKSWRFFVALYVPTIPLEIRNRSDPNLVWAHLTLCWCAMSNNFVGTGHRTRSRRFQIFPLLNLYETPLCVTLANLHCQRKHLKWKTIKRAARVGRYIPDNLRSSLWANANFTWVIRESCEAPSIA